MAAKAKAKATDAPKVLQWAARLSAATASRQPMQPISRAQPAFTLADARKVQKAGLTTRVKSGQRLIGANVRIVGRSLWTDGSPGEPVAGYLTDAMLAAPESRLEFDAMIAPAAQIAFAFVLSRDLEGPGLTMSDVLAAVDAVHGAIEIVDSRFAPAPTQICDVVADNTANSIVILTSGCIPPHSADLALTGCALEQHGRIVASATGAAALGHPAAAVALAAADLAGFGRLTAGSIILAGDLIDPVLLKKGEAVSAKFARIGTAFAISS